MKEWPTEEKPPRARFSTYVEKPSSFAWFLSIFWLEAARGSKAEAEHSVLLWGWADVTNWGLLIAEKQQVLLSEKHL